MIIVAGPPSGSRLDESAFATAPLNPYERRTASVKGRPRVARMRFLAIAASFFTIAILVAPHP